MVSARGTKSIILARLSVGLLACAERLRDRAFCRSGRRPRRPGSLGRFQSGVDLISVTATVVDRDGHLVTGLPIEAFEIFEEGERQTITQFTNERVPVSLAVLLDVSDSMFGQRLVDARSAVETISVRAARQERRVLRRGVQSRASRADALDAGAGRREEPRWPR